MFRFKRLDIPEVIMIEPQLFGDERGFFMESYKRSEFAISGIAESFVQDNHSCSSRGVVRGLHYQNPPAAQAKLVRAVSGEIFDVAVDIRKGSPAYGRWVGVVLSSSNRRMVYIPAGFAHGFQATSEVAEVIYKSSAEYAPRQEAGVLWSDPQIGIQWPLKDAVVSPRDARWPGLFGAVNGFVYGGGP